MFCTLVLGAALLQQQTITFTHPCANSAVVLEALGKRLGVTMRPSGSVTKDYFLVSFHDITKEEALDKIASALNATWEEKNDVTYLTRTHNQELAEKDAVHKQEVQAIQEWLDKNKVTDDFTLDKAKGMLEQLLPLAPYPGSYDEVRLNKFDEIEKSSPINRYALRLAAEIGAEAIAQTYLSDPIVFTQNPTGSQRQFPNGPATRLFEEETATLKEALRQTKTVEKWPEDGRDSNFVTPFSGVKEFTFGPKDLRITIRNYGLGYDIQLNVPDYRSAGVYINSLRNVPTAVPQALLSQQTSYVPSDFEKAIVPTILAVFGSMTGQSGAFKPVGAEQAKVLNDPLHYEPLSLLGSKWMLDTAASLDKNLIAVLDDEEDILSLVGGAQGMSTLGQLWSLLPQMGARYQITDQDGWITVLPGDPAAVREEHVDRVAWQKALAGVDPKQIADLDTLAAFAALGGGGSSVMLAALPAGLQAGPDFFEHFLNPDLEVLRIYGRLDRRYRVMAKNGGAEIPVAQLRQDVAKELLQLVGQDHVVVSSRQPRRGWGAPNSQFYGSNDKSGTEVVAGGMPANAVLRVSTMRQDVIYRQPSEGKKPDYGHTSDEIGQQIANADVYSPNGSTPLRPYFVIATAEQLYIEVEFPGVGYYSRIVQIDHLPSNVVYMTLKELPQDVQDQIAKAADKYRVFYKRLKGGGGEKL